ALVLVDEGVLPTNPLLATLRPKAQVREFRPIDQKAVPAWVRTRAAEMGLSLSREAIQLLADLVGSNLWTLAGELDKLAAYSDGRPVTEEDVRSLVAAAKEANIFAMVDAIVERRPASAVRLLRQLAAQGVTSAHVFGMIVRQYRLLLLAREMLDARAPSGRIAEALDIRSAFALDRLLDRAERYTIPRLKGAYRRLLEADASIKRGIHSEELALDLLIHDLAAA
ncbi:MAG: DNA polymerase III subunit delta, partial [Chloroflexi bacterium]|nr:DNA polymerase III subunit delta [Chloroflexota bacterium]